MPVQNAVSGEQGARCATAGPVIPEAACAWCGVPLEVQLRVPIEGTPRVACSARHAVAFAERMERLRAMPEQAERVAHLVAPLRRCGGCAAMSRLVDGVKCWFCGCVAVIA